MSIADIRKQSLVNLQHLIKTLAKYPIKRTDEEVELVIKSLPIYHCVRDSNIIEVLKTQEIKVKNQVVQGEFTNQSTDLFQGFEQHLSMSVGEPWIEYGQYAFSYGLEHIHPESLAFSADPWKWNADKFQKNILTVSDFTIYLREVLKRNLRRISKNIYIQIPWNCDLHKLAITNFRKWEIKQAENLKITDAEEFFVWSNIDNFVYMFVKIFGNWLILLLLLGLLGIVVYTRVTA